MEEQKSNMQYVQAQSLLARFRSKEDIYRYLTQHAGVFLPSLAGTSLSFLKDILCNEKKTLDAGNVIHMEVPNYQELSVRSLYEDAIRDPKISKYLPTKDQVPSRLPERRFFFGVLATIDTEKLSEMIKEAHEKRFKLPEGNEQKEGILISDKWLEELMKHPYYSKKKGSGIFLLKEKAKVRKAQAIRTMHQPTKRLFSDTGLDDSMMTLSVTPDKRIKNSQGKMVPYVQKERRTAPQEEMKD